jgi:hypothetical protein
VTSTALATWPFSSSTHVRIGNRVPSKYKQRIVDGEVREDAVGAGRRHVADVPEEIAISGGLANSKSRFGSGSAWTTRPRGTRRSGLVGDGVDRVIFRTDRVGLVVDRHAEHAGSTISVSSYVRATRPASSSTCAMFGRSSRASPPAFTWVRC